MGTRVMTVDVNGVDYEARVGTIKSTTIGAEDHGIFTVGFEVKGDPSWGVGIGGYNNMSNAGPWIEALMRVAGVARWEAMRGQLVVVLFDNGRAVGLQHATLEDRTVLLSDLATEAYDKVAKLVKAHG